APETFGSLALIQSIFEERASINLTVFGIFNTYLWRSFGRRMGSRTRRTGFRFGTFLGVPRG
ncbi:unnamed protein product, partial [Symbiodinium microadriaticum]